MIQDQNSKKYDLEERTFSFAKKVREFVKKIPRSETNRVYVDQLIRSSSSIGANYIEANESMSKKDFAMRVKICRKEAKETRYWLNLIEVSGGELENEKLALAREVEELMKIFGSIVEKVKF
ncbi:MAG: hypothetical protein UX80_C0035G0003 [Candidatus Amesbacteria bacterium GW2011_GWA2_47_11b]|uniref:Four helix bundle protein n=1 Tax=Candidatus Amesbacteria bacterium GW2011_GWA2_47_11b TaxID=1618358 RepID=A0A0G1TQS5_9BACT|nr:MAG: hypothetical protein UX42_C0020G0008 [Microgenomates group bacterium GW2011_GWC1_46_20]KKU56528.1 MAG: hypothetical protein UX80_C0035G0003 [Candidatus Amesbacteria bacterium GW2011_GWA2_47_11b]